MEEAADLFTRTARTLRDNAVVELQRSNHFLRRQLAQNTSNPCTNSRSDLQRKLMNSLNAQKALQSQALRERLERKEKFKQEQRLKASPEKPSKEEMLLLLKGC